MKHSERITQVKIWGRTAGYAWWDRKEMCAVFEYDPKFADDGTEIAPLTMPLSTRPYRFRSLSRETFQGLPGMLSDSLPDAYGSTLIDRWIAQNNIDRSEFTPLDRLCYIGRRGMGALEYEPAAGDGYDGAIDVNKLSDLAAEVLRQRDGMRTDASPEGIHKLLSVGTSAGGARAKAVIGMSVAGDIRSGQTELPEGYSHWLIKFDTEPSGAEKRGYCRIEHAYYEMAKECGIDMTECRLLETDDKAHFITRRFDRTGKEKAHIQTLCALAHFDFKVPGKHSYEEMMQMMRHLRMPYPDLEQTFRRMVFNVIMRNNDDHTKNFSFILRENGEWRTAPAYDVTYAYDPANYWIQRHQMSVCGKTREITRKDIMRVAHDAGIRGAADITDTVLSTAAEWTSYARSSGVPERMTERIDKALLKDV
ncbi:MAG: type II toxin-antitoxin system HipA family toxin [Methanomassiliicoccaceae archaeon]|jgi:serine/threonine-protein kinase HipA|nr:type II toxin-antitoxin system HipA family toxin [Methanomassiliicoccaceae archaeon]